jgi:hypothetical protein
MEECLRQRGQLNGFVFQTSKGKQSKVGNYEEKFLSRLVKVGTTKYKLFDAGVKVVEVYSLRRSLR